MAPPVDLQAQVALVTGAGRGVGRAIAMTLGNAGASVCVTARSEGEVAQAAQEIRQGGGRSLGLRCDVTDRAAVRRAVETTAGELGPITLLVNNAGTLDALGPFWETDPDLWWRDVEVHVRGTQLCTHAVLPSMLERGHGRIINVVGMLGQRGEPYVTAYACAKAALFRLTDCLSREVAERGIKVFGISPGPVRTEMTVRLAESEEGRKWTPYFAELDDDGWTPAEEGAQLVARLAGGEADTLSGRFIHVERDLAELVGRAADIESEDRLVMRMIG